MEGMTTFPATFPEAGSFWEGALFADNALVHSTQHSWVGPCNALAHIKNRIILCELCYNTFRDSLPHTRKFVWGL